MTLLQMPNEKRKATRAQWTLANMQAAVRDMILYKHSGEKRSNKDNDAPKESQRRHIK